MGTTEIYKLYRVIKIVEPRDSENIDKRTVLEEKITTIRLFFET